MTASLREEMLERIIREHVEWCDRAVATLVAEGFAVAEIGIEQHPGNRTLVRARGVPRFERTITVTANDQLLTVLPPLHLPADPNRG